MKNLLVLLSILLCSLCLKSQAVIYAGDNKKIFPGESTQLSASGNCSSFSWFPPNGLDYTNISNPIASPSVTTRYYVTGTTEFGDICIDSVDVIVSSISLIDMANAFNPASGQYKILIRGTFNLKYFKIFNRYGVEVFSTNNVNIGWDGRYKGNPQPIGTYVYTVSGDNFNKTGNFLLIR